MTDTKPCGCNQYQSCGRDHAAEQAAVGAENTTLLASTPEPLVLTVIRQEWNANDYAIVVGEDTFDAAPILRAMDPDERERVLSDMAEGGYEGAETLYEAAVSARMVESHGGPFDVTAADGDLADIATGWAERNPVGNQDDRDARAIELSGRVLTSFDEEEAEFERRLQAVRRRRMEIGNAVAILEADEFDDDDELYLIEWTEASDEKGWFSACLRDDNDNHIYLSGQDTDDGPSWGFNALSDDDSDEPTYTMGRLREWARRTLV